MKVSFMAAIGSLMVVMGYKVKRSKNEFAKRRNHTIKDSELFKGSFE
ncbi:hypothetical protein KVK74_03210 [Helicobacter pylori]|nr:hypothetical protein KVK74_03210 [Helicobacter pylori]